MSKQGRSDEPRTQASGSQDSNGRESGASPNDSTRSQQGSASQTGSSQPGNSQPGSSPLGSSQPGSSPLGSSHAGSSPLGSSSQQGSSPLGSSSQQGSSQQGGSQQGYGQQSGSQHGYGQQGGSQQGQSRDQGGAREERSDRDGGARNDTMRESGWSQSAGGARRWRTRPQAARDVMTRNPKSVRPNDTVQQIAQIMVDEDTGIVPVVENGRLMGVVTDRDIVCRLVARGADLRTAKASEVMTDDVECVTERDGLDEVLRLMGEHQIRRIPVVDRDDRLVGIISMADVAREADVDEKLQDTFEEISSERQFWSHLR